MGTARRRLVISVAGLVAASAVILASAAGLTSACSGADDSSCASACRNGVTLCKWSSSSSSSDVDHCTSMCELQLKYAGSSRASQEFTVECLAIAKTCDQFEACSDY